MFPHDYTISQKFLATFYVSSTRPIYFHKAVSCFERSVKAKFGSCCTLFVILPTSAVI